MDKTLNEYYLSTYDFKFTPTDFLKALEFYIKTLDDLDINIINKKSEFLNRKELFQIRDFLSKYKDDDSIKHYRTGGPWIKPIFDGIIEEKIESKTLLALSSMFITNLIYIQDIGIHIMSVYAKYHIKVGVEDLKLSDKINHLLDIKYQLKLNSNIYPYKHIEEINNYLEICLNYYKEKVEISGTIDLSEIKNMVEANHANIQKVLDSNELSNSLYNSDFPTFISKLKELLFIPSYYDIVESDLERTFHIYTLSIFVSSLKLYKVKSNKESGLGRYDIALMPADNTKHCVIIEIKKSNTIPTELDFHNTISQIITKSYNSEFKLEGYSKFLYIALVFYKKEPFLSFRIVDEDLN